jgi:hypothetical protein
MYNIVLHAVPCCSIVGGVVEEPLRELEAAGDLLQQHAEPEAAGTGAVDDLLKRMTAKERYVFNFVYLSIFLLFFYYFSFLLRPQTDTAAACMGGGGVGNAANRNKEPVQRGLPSTDAGRKLYVVVRSSILPVRHQPGQSDWHVS